MLTFEEKLQADKDWLKARLDDFDIYATNQGLNAEDVARHRIPFRSFVWGQAFAEDIDGREINKSETASYAGFDMDADGTNGKGDAVKSRKNLLTLWLEYLDSLKISEPSRLFILDGQRSEVSHLKALPDTMLYIHAGKDSNHWRLYEALLRDNEAGPAITPVSVSSLVKPVFVPSRWSGAISALGGIAAGMATSYLLNSVSRMAICTVLGLSSVHVPVILVVGLTAGVATAVKNVHKNAGAIRQSVRDADGFGGKSLAAVIATAKAVQVRQVLVNSVLAAGGTLIGGVVMDSLLHGFNTVASCTMDQLGLHFGNASVADTVNQTLQNLTSEQTTLGTHDAVIDARIDQLQTQFNIEHAARLAADEQIKALQEAAINNNGHLPVAATTVVDTSVHVVETPVPASSECVGMQSWPDPKPGMPNPSYVHDGTPYCSERVETAVQATNAPPILKPDDATIVVKAGDTLTDIVEQEYNIAEGSANFDKVMAEVAKANGLVAAQQNWLKINWELHMPDMANPANLNGQLDRSLLDANWRAGDVIYSAVPKLAA